MSVNLIDLYGIQTKTLPDIIASLTTAFQTIYGADVNLASNSPDGQLLNQIALMCLDHANLVTQDYSSKDPDQAVGVALDGVSQLCGLTRRGGTYTVVNVVVTVDRAVNLTGIGSTSPFTISDATGNLFQLISNASLTTGANTLAFQAVNIGDVQISLNTLITITTPILGVLSVNNPAAPTTQGVDQETDAAFRLRRQAAVALPAGSALDGLIGGLQTVTGLTQAVVRENTGASTDGDGIPGHGIWVITDGGATLDIANMIYKYRPLGVPMAGAVTQAITQADGTTITMSFDTAVTQNLYIAFTATSKSGGSLDTAAIKAYLAANLSYGIYEIADVSTIIKAVYDFNPDAVVSLAGVSNTAGSYATTKLPAAKKNKWVVLAANIAIS